MTNTNNAPLLPEPLRDALDRLSRRDEVLGALLIGSLAAGAFTPASDYDLVVVVNGKEPLWYVGVTEIGGRFADIVFVAGHALAQIQALDAPVAHDYDLAPVLRWIGDGVIVLDRGGLRAAQEHARAHSLLAPPGGESAYRAWFGLNYNLAVIRRLLQSEDPRYLAVADIRTAVYGHADLWFGYFAIRGQLWPGDKAALRALEAQNHAYLALFLQFIAEHQRTEKARLYAELAALAAAPLGGLWPPGWTGENLAQPPLRIAELLDTSGAADQTSREL
jgi:predicted nucleotidyltransferase